MWVPSSRYLARSQPALPIHLLAFPSRAVLRVSLYLPWRPADVHCGGLEYSSYQYGLHQCWISHSGLAHCPPAAYSNIVSRIVIFEAEPRLSSLQAAEYSQRKNQEKEIVCASTFETKMLQFFFVAEGNRWRLHLVTVARRHRNGRAEERWKEKSDQGQNRA